MSTPPKHLRLDCHAEREGEEDVKKHDGHDGDGEPNHEVLIALDLVSEGGVAALEVVAHALTVIIIGIGLTAGLDKIVNENNLSNRSKPSPLFDRM